MGNPNLPLLPAFKQDMAISPPPLFKTFQRAALLVGILWLVWGIEWLLDLNLGVLGVYPRQASGLIGLLTAPLVHGNFDHLVSNSLPLLLLGTGVWVFYYRERWPVLLTAYLAPSLWVWVAGRPSYHIGASGVLYTLAFFVFFSGVFRKEPRSLALSLIVAFLYGSMVWGIFPHDPGISWESHLFGAIAGLVLAFYFRNNRPPRKRYSWEDPATESPDDAPEPWNYKVLFPPPGE